MTSGRFLSASEQKEYEKPDRVVARRIAPPESLRTLQFSEHLEAVAKSVVKSASASFKGLIIGVHERDGMTWSAEAAARVIETKFPDNLRKVYALPGEKTKNALPYIAQLVGERAFLKIAARHQLTVSFFSPYFAIAVAAAVGAVILLGKAAVDVQIRHEPWSAPTLLTALLFAAFSAITKVIEHFVEKGKPDAAEEFKKRILGENLGTTLTGFVDSLALQLGAQKDPRAIIVDDFDALDDITQGVIRAYFRAFARDAGISELWVIFAAIDSPGLAAEVGTRREGSVYASIEVYEQQLISDVERRRLRLLLGRPETAEDFASIGPVCSEPVEGNDGTLALLREYHRLGLSPIGGIQPFRLFYLLSLTSSPGGQHLPEGELVSAMATTYQWRTPILLELLGASRLDRNSVKDALVEVRKSFGRLVLVHNEEQKPEIRIRPEVERIIVKEAANFSLPPADLGHLYWTLTLYDQRDRMPRGAYYARKLAHHLSKCSPAGLKERELYASLLPHLMEIFLYGLNVCLKSGVLKPVPDLIERATNLYLSESRVDQNRLRVRLTQLCWDAFALLGEHSILEHVLEIRDASLEPASSNEGIPEQMILEHFYCDALALDDDDRQALATELFPPPSRSSATRDATADYVRMQAAWAALTLAPSEVSLTVDVNRLIAAAQIVVSDTTRLATSRAAGKEERSLTSLMAASLGVWCLAIRWVNFVEDQRAMMQWVKHRLQQGQDADPLYELIDACETIVLLALELQESATKAVGRGGDFPRDVLARDMCTVAVGALALVGSTLREPKWRDDFINKLDGERLKIVNQTMTAAAQILGVRFPDIRSFADLRDQALHATLGDLWPLHEAIWSRFGLRRLSAVVGLRNLQFEALQAPFKGSDQIRQDQLIRSAGALATSGADILALVSDLSLAHAYREIAELSAFYLGRSGHFVLAGAHPMSIKHEMCWIVIATARQSHDLKPFVDRLLELDPSGTCQLARLLDAVDGPIFVGVALRVLNADGSEPVCDVIRVRAKTLPPEVGGEVECLLDVRRLNADIRANRPFAATSDLLKAWPNRDLWLYASLLELLLQSRGAHEMVMKEAARVLNREPRWDNYNSYVFLAITTLEFAPETATNETAIRYLQSSIDRWTSKMTAELNARAFMMLYRHGSAERKVEYLEQLTKWEGIRLQRDHIRRLPQLVQTGGYFLIFMNYYDGMERWGLRSDPPLRSLQTKQREVDAKPETVLAGAVEYDEVPSAVAGRDAAAAVNGWFLHHGLQLFSPPREGNAEYAELREKFNEEAQRMLPWLLQLLDTVAEMPLPLRELFRRYSSELLEAIDESPESPELGRRSA